VCLPFIDDGFTFGISDPGCGTLSIDIIKVMAKILLVEDDLMLSKLVCQNLRARFHVVDAVSNAEDAEAYLLGSSFDLVIMDWFLVGADSAPTGVDLCATYRKHGGRAPVLFLTGQSTIEHKTAGFGAGADDYLCKPFDMKELILRIDSLLRRPVVKIHSEMISCGELHLDARAGLVIYKEQEIHLQPREMALLEFLMKHPGTLFEPSDLLERVWETDSDSSELALRTCVSNLRKKLGITGRKELIESVHGRGYRFNSN
jgi:DNA-binding response OmpR family regulator